MCSKKEPIKLGFVGGLSGRVADLGISGRNGAILAVEHWNNAGGVNGRPVTLVVMDDEQNQEVAEKAVNELINQNVVAIIGHMTSAMSTRTVPIVNNNKIVMMSPTTTTTHLSAKDDYFFRVCSTTDKYAAKMARYLRNTIGLKNVSVIYDLGNKSYTENWISKFREEFEGLGGHISHQTTFTSGPDVLFHNVVEDALVPDIEGIVISANALDSAMINQQVLKQKGKKMYVGTSEWAATEKLINLGGIAVEGVIVSQFFNRDNPSVEYLSFKEEYIKQFGTEPGFASVAGYDAANIILTSLSKQQKGQDLKDTILDISLFHVLQGNLSIDRLGDAERETHLSIVQDGKFVMIY